MAATDPLAGAAPRESDGAVLKAFAIAGGSDTGVAVWRPATSSWELLPRSALEDWLKGRPLSPDELEALAVGPFSPPSGSTGSELEGPKGA